MRLTTFRFGAPVPPEENPCLVERLWHANVPLGTGSLLQRLQVPGKVVGEDF